MQIVFEGITILRNALLQSGYGEKELSRSMRIYLERDMRIRIR
jgi:hypothetical protein